MWNPITAILLCTTLVVAFVLSLMFGLPVYGVWQQGLAGEAALARADQDRQITITEARAELESSKLLNLAEVERAKGLRDATELVAGSFGGTDAYLKYLRIQSIKNNDADVIYVPTEAGLPILEAGRMLKATQVQ